MCFMEEFNLNRAHQIERQAEKLIKHQKFDEAASAYSEAIDLMESLQSNIINPKISESLTMQRDHLLKQRNLMLSVSKKDSNYSMGITSEDCEYWHTNDKIALNSIKNVIDEKFVKIKDVLHLLAERETIETKSKELTSKVDTLSSDTDGNTRLATKLIVLNEELERLCNALVDKINTGINNNRKTKIKEKEEQKEIVASPSNTSNVLKITAYDSSGGTSPFVFSPCTEIYPDIPED